MIEYLITYFFLFCASGIVAGLVYEDGNKKLGARMALLSPVWPLLAVYGLWWLVGFLWEKADLGDWTDWVKK